MPAIQTTYNATLPIALVGMFADMRNRTVLSREVGGTVAIAFGAVALRGTTDHTILPVGGTGAGGFLGIVGLDPTIRAQIAAGNAFAVGDTADVLLKGAIWVTVTSNVTPGTPVYYDGSGNLTATATSNTAIVGATFETTATSGGLAVVRL